MSTHTSLRRQPLHSDDNHQCRCFAASLHSFNHHSVATSTSLCRFCCSCLTRRHSTTRLPPPRAATFDESDPPSFNCASQDQDDASLSSEDRWIVKLAGNLSPKRTTHT